MTRAKYFSKSSYTKGLQCPKILWMDSHMKDKFDKSLIDLNRLKAGSDIGDMAMAYFGEFVEVEMNFKFDEMAARTSELIAEALQMVRDGKKPFSICEATFVSDGMLCMADIVLVRADGALDVIEVKSSTSVKDYHLSDVAYQTAVIEACGYEVATASIMHINSDYVLDGELDLKGLFKVENVTDEARARAQGITGTVAEMMAYREGEEEPSVQIGLQCNNPHDCGYQSWCWRSTPKDSVLNFAGMSRAKAFDLLNAGISTFAEALGKVKLSAFQEAQAGGKPIFKADFVAEFLTEVYYPVYHLDFETIQPIVPIYQGTKPWQQIPTQFSVHRVDEPGAAPEHFEFLAQHDEDPRRSVAEALCATIPAGACVTAYNMAFEKGRIKELAATFPDLAEHLISIHDSIVDLMVPFRNGWVYLPEMNSSYSIKKVLPALCQNDPQLDYTGLDGVHNGTEAMEAFEKLGTMEAEQRQQVREQLLRYCELDTLAMCKVHERLVELARDFCRLTCEDCA